MCQDQCTFFNSLEDVVVNETYFHANDLIIWHVLWYVFNNYLHTMLNLYSVILFRKFNTWINIGCQTKTDKFTHQPLEESRQ